MSRSTPNEPGRSVAGPPVDEYARAAPAPALRPYIAWYSGYRQRGVPPASHRGLPSPYLTLIFTLDEPLVILGHPDSRQPPGAFDSLLGGLHTAPVMITHAGAQSGVQVALRPLGTRALLGLPAGELTAVDLPAEDVLGGVGARLRERMHGALGWRERFAVLDDMLTALVGADRRIAPAPAPEVDRAWRLLRRSGGTAAVADLAAEVGWSTRHLSQRFRVEVGLAPKAAGRVIRFDRTRHLLAARAQRGSEIRLADLAADTGYFDQAHLAREFRALAGCPPSRWLAEEFRNIQAGHHDLGESSEPSEPPDPPAREKGPRR